MKTRRTKKVGCALLASCILLSSCGQSTQSSPQDLTQEAQEPTDISQTTQSHNLNTMPEPTPTNTPIPTPEPTPISTSASELTPVLDFTFLPHLYEPDKISLLDYMTQEEIDAAFSLSYDPYAKMQLYARYQGRLQALKYSHGYCIDIIQVGAAMDLLINIKIYSGSVRYLKYGDSEILQNMCYYDNSSLQLDVAKEVLQVMDINNDGYDDFVFDLGFSGNQNKYSLAFVYDVENAAYVLLDDFFTATYMPEKQTVYEREYHTAEPTQLCKYIVVGTNVILTECVSELSGVSGISYSYQKLIGGELVSLLEYGTYEELCEFIGDFETWEKMPATLE